MPPRKHVRTAQLITLSLSRCQRECFARGAFVKSSGGRPACRPYTLSRARFDPPRSVPVAEAVLLLADFARSRRLGVVNAVGGGLERAQVREHGLEVFVGHVSEGPPGHRVVELAGLDVARAYR